MVNIPCHKGTRKELLVITIISITSIRKRGWQRKGISFFRVYTMCHSADYKFSFNSSYNLQSYLCHTCTCTSEQLIASPMQVRFYFHTCLNSFNMCCSCVWAWYHSDHRQRGLLLHSTCCFQIISIGTVNTTVSPQECISLLMIAKSETFTSEIA